MPQIGAMVNENINGKMPRNDRLVQYLNKRYGEDEIQINIAKFAEEMGVSYGAVKKWIWDGRRPRYDMQKRIAKLTKGRVSFEHW